jgi:hypothetical protein
MIDTVLASQLSFRVHLIRIYGSESHPTMRFILVETKSARTIYEGFGTWEQCLHWLTQLSGWAIPIDELVAIEKRLMLKQLATIQEVKASLADLDRVGLLRATS